MWDEGCEVRCVRGVREVYVCGRRGRYTVISEKS